MTYSRLAKVKCDNKAAVLDTAFLSMLEIADQHQLIYYVWEDPRCFRVELIFTIPSSLIY